MPVKAFEVLYFLMIKQRINFMKKLFIFLSLFITGISVAVETKLSGTEDKIIAIIDENMLNANQLLEQLVNINSGTMNFEGVKQVGKILKSEFDNLGMETRWIDGKDFNRAGHLVASIGNSGPKILLIGHLDTVFEPDSPFQNYEPLDNNRVKGPGITDMKGGDVVIVEVIRALKAAGVLNKLSLKVILTGDEERSGKPISKSRYDLLEAAKWADIAIGFEDGDGDPKTAVVARRGSVGWKLEVTGKPAHSSQIFREDIGYGAIFETARILNTFRESLEKEKNLTFNPGIIVGGTDIEFNAHTARGKAYGKNNVIAQSVKVTGGIRAVSPKQLTMAKNKMQKIVSQNLNKTSAVLTFSEGYPPMAPRPSNYKLLELYNRISLDLGYGEVKAVDPRRAGAADISFAANHVAMSIDGLGLMGDGGHTDNEIADMSTFDMQIKRAAILLYRLAKP